MKKILILLSGALFLPSMVFGAAYNDVTLNTGTAVLSVGGYTINVAGTDAVLQSISVDATSFTVTMLPSSYFKASAPDLNQLSPDAGTFTNTGVCNGSESSLTLYSNPLSGLPSSSVTITPSATLCADSSSSSSSNASNGAPASGGGGGGSYVPYVPPATPAIHGVSPAISATPAIPASITFTGVSVGSRGANDIKILQQILNADPDTSVASVGAGSPGHETTYFGPATKKAIQKFQTKYGISSAGKSDYGTFGPKTKAKLNEIAKLKGLISGGTTPSTGSTSSPQGSSGQATNNAASIAQQISDALKLIQTLQAQLKALGH